jgi:hypothetical protein
MKDWFLRAAAIRALPVRLAALPVFSSHQFQDPYAQSCTNSIKTSYRNFCRFHESNLTVSHI